MESIRQFFSYETSIKRVRNLKSIPESVKISAKAVGITILGIGGTFLSIATLGKVKTFNQWADKTGCVKYILPTLYAGIMEVINPDIQYNLHDIEKDSFLSTIPSRLREYATVLALDPRSFVKQHVFSRGLHLAAAVISMHTKTADLALGVFAAILSIVTLGKVEKINTLAARNLRSLDILDDLCKDIRGIINPQQFIDLTELLYLF